MVNVIMYRDKGTRDDWKPVARQRVYTEEEREFLRWDCTLLHRSNKNIYEYCMMRLLPDQDQEIKVYSEDEKSRKEAEEEFEEGEEDEPEEDAGEIEST